MYIKSLTISILALLVSGCGGGGGTSGSGTNTLTINMELNTKAKAMLGSLESSLPAPKILISSDQAGTHKYKYAASPFANGSSSVSISTVGGMAVSKNTDYYVFAQPVVGPSGILCSASNTNAAIVNTNSAATINYTCMSGNKATYLQQSIKINNQTFNEQKTIGPGDTILVYPGASTTLTLSGGKATDVQNFLATAANNASLLQYSGNGPSWTLTIKKQADMRPQLYSGKINNQELNIALETVPRKALIGYYNQVPDGNYTTPAYNLTSAIGSTNNNDNFDVVMFFFANCVYRKASPTATTATPIWDMHDISRADVETAIAKGAVPFISIGGWKYRDSVANCVNSAPVASANTLMSILPSNIAGIDLDIEAAVTPSDFINFVQTIRAQNPQSTKKLYLSFAPAAGDMGDNSTVPVFQMLLTSDEHWFGWVQSQTYGGSSDTTYQEAATNAGRADDFAAHYAYGEAACYDENSCYYANMSSQWTTQNATENTYYPTSQKTGKNTPRGVMGWDMFWNFWGCKTQRPDQSCSLQWSKYVRAKYIDN